MGSFDELHGLRNGVAKLEAEIEELRRTLRLAQAASPGSHANSKIIAEIQRCEEIRKGMLHELTLRESDFWRGFADRFMELACEEQGRTDVITSGNVLRAMNVARISCNYRKRPEVLEMGKPEQGFFCLLETPPHGVWGRYDGYRSENFLERIRLCVVEAGRALPEHPKGADPEDFWLHRVYLNLLKNRSDSLFCASEEGGMIVSVCVASATFCARLARGAFAYAEPSIASENLRTGTNQVESAPVQSSENSAPAVDIDRAIASWKRMHEVDGEPQPPGQNEDISNSIPRDDVEVFEHDVWVSFFDEARLARPVEIEWESVLSSKKAPNEHADLGLTLALTKEYVKAVARAVAKVADLLAMAAISRHLRLTQPLRETMWRECLDFANGLARWDAFGTWVEKATRIQWNPPLTEDGSIDRDELQEALAKRKGFFESRIRMYASEWLSAADGAVDLRLTASGSDNSLAQNSEETVQPQRMDSNDANDTTGNARRTFLLPLLDKKGWSVHDWANNADVDWHTADDYLKGKTNPYQSSRKKMADALGIENSELPD